MEIKPVVCKYYIPPDLFPFSLIYIYIYIYMKVKLATVVEGDPKASLP